MAAPALFLCLPSYRFLFLSPCPTVPCGNWEEEEAVGEEGTMALGAREPFFSASDSNWSARSGTRAATAIKR
uniref:Secreted protein n=1 Tax=Globodera pallida TaxID=36090 RepID=A0A183CHK7_GLOPA